MIHLRVFVFVKKTLNAHSFQNAKVSIFHREYTPRNLRKNLSRVYCVQTALLLELASLRPLCVCFDSS